MVIKKIKDAKMAKYWKENQEGLLNDGEALTILMMLYNEHPYVVQLPCLNKQLQDDNRYAQPTYTIYSTTKNRKENKRRIKNSI
ncbi:hypothetical protein LOR91_13540 [Staphylococcus aureus]|uniref:hypothetical protein n=1 Tax=Bacilli TaxID=91061 RepID=UPI000B2EDDDB|nr:MULTISPECIES: hypothetical protein [Bacilli]MDU7210058.1 hypothetical protein [Streptococcus sp.]MBN5674860.1 hypothetical protein [Staphylococcus aureus]MBW8189318.1 hypothetical protein [Staphylococcus aureus]MBW8233094.1 hypothetical protein [Staphylococcus aureus]MCF0314471.1 hypothetical protein [Staphylococcus aureus]